MAAATIVKLYVPAPLRRYCNGASELTLAAASVRALLDELERRYAALYLSVCDETGAVRRHVNLFVHEANIRDRNGLDTPLVAGDVVTILPAISGG
ncbi:MAG: MoaD/ThiS family protein [Planctomycetes bacterium]|nr:MoaD/ThiS family protein [Planctomycetota bacterium]